MARETIVPTACQDCSHLDELRASLHLPEAGGPVPSTPVNSTPLEEMRAVLPGAFRSFRTDQTITLEGDAEAQVIGVISGLIRCFRISSDGRRYINRFAGPGAIIGIELCGHYRYSAEALTDCETVVFRSSAVEAAYESQPLLRRAIRSAMTMELAERERAEFRLARMASDERVADFLLEISNEGETSPVYLPMPRVDIADHLGITLETVSRSLHKLDRQGLIRLRNAHCFDIPSGRALRGFIHGSVVGFTQPKEAPAHPASVYSTCPVRRAL